MANFFNLAGLREIRGGAGSRWAGLIPNIRRNNAVVAMDPAVRGLLARTQVAQLREENVLRDPDLEQAIGGLSMLGGGLDHANFPNMMALDRVRELIPLAVGDRAVNHEIFFADQEVNVNGFVSDWPNAFPTQPAQGVVIIRADTWRRIIADVQAGNHGLQNNQPGGPPAGAVVAPAANEMNPYSMAGYINVNMTNGQALPNRAGMAPHVLEFIAMVALRNAAGARRRQDIMNLLVIGVTIITSGGNITQGRLRKVMQAAARELMVDVDLNREVIQRGWDFLSAHWAGNQMGADFQQMFQMLQQSTQGISLRLGLMCQQTELKMLTGIVTVLRAINAFQDFPWQNLFDAIANLTGRDEAAVILAFADYIDPPAVPAGQNQPAAPAVAGGHWAGWEFALRTQQQGMRRNPEFINLLYAGIQLSIQAGGNLSLRGYAALDNATVPAKLVIDTWIAAYIAGRGAANYPFPNAGGVLAPGATLQAIRNHNI